jgi:hypothetical protein
LLRDHPDIELLVDSGAFSALNSGAAVDLDSYIAWLKENEAGVDHAIALDVLGNPEQTDKNLQTMLDAGITTVPVHVLGDDEARMDKLFELSDYVAFGGLRRPRRGWAPKSYVAEKMKWAKGRRVHWLGYTKHGMITRFRPHSCDSANIAGGQMWGHCMLYHGNNRWSRTTRKQFIGGGMVLPPEFERFSDQLGYSAEDWYDDANWKRDKGRIVMCFELTMYSFLLYSLDVYRRTGVRYYNAVSEYRVVGEILRLLNVVKENNESLLHGQL